MLITGLLQDHLSRGGITHSQLNIDAPTGNLMEVFLNLMEAFLN